METDKLREAVKALAADCGYVACGITSALPFVRDREIIEGRICRYPEAKELYEGFRRRTDPRTTAPWCNSVVVCIRWYGKYRLPKALLGHVGRTYLGDCRSKICPDYTMAKRMTQGLRDLGMRCKKGGVPDRWAAARAGVGRFGRNSLIYVDGYGSWVNIQTWRVDAELEPDEPTLDFPCPDGCRACMDACPTGAIEGEFCTRMDKCIAYLTYEAPFPIQEDLWKKMGEWVYGCDLCQQVCPLNEGKWMEQEEAPWIAEIADLLTPKALAGMSGETYRQIVHPLFWYIAEDDADRWKANARRAVEQGEGKD